ncbi:hypothetical protein HMPREF3190_01448 [Umbribacter vaginalis]|nr:hypothetical protein HMPREF3190_01448 [Coriobacteriales bacterium DNF00809]
MIDIIHTFLTIVTFLWWSAMGHTKKRPCAMHRRFLHITLTS